MSSMSCEGLPFDAPLRVTLRPSKQLRAVFTAAHGVAMCACVLLVHQRWIVALMLAVLLVSLSWWMRYTRRDATIQVDTDGSWQLWSGDQHWSGLQPTAVSTGPRWVSLVLAPIGRLIILPDAVGDAAHRQLRARLNAR